MSRKEDESLDDLILGGMRVYQPLDGYRFSIDAVLLAFFAEIKPQEKIVDLGTGCGVIPLILAWREPNITITGIDIIDSVTERAERNVQLNGLSPRIRIIQGDVKNIEHFQPKHSAQVVLSNPPFWKKGEGKVSIHKEQALARHEIEMQLMDVVSAAAYLLSSGGRFYIVQRSERLAELLLLLAEANLYPSKLRTIHSFWDQSAKMVLVEAVKNTKAKLSISSPLIIYMAPNVYTPEIQAMYGR